MGKMQKLFVTVLFSRAMQAACFMVFLCFLFYCKLLLNLLMDWTLKNLENILQFFVS